MKKLGLRAEYLGELSTTDLRQVAGAAGGGDAPNTVSDGSCGCTIPLGAILPAAHCDISDRSCGCFCGAIEIQTGTK